MSLVFVPTSVSALLVPLIIAMFSFPNEMGYQENLNIDLTKKPHYSTPTRRRFDADSMPEYYVGANPDASQAWRCRNSRRAWYLKPPGQSFFNGNTNGLPRWYLPKKWTCRSTSKTSSMPSPVVRRPVESEIEYAITARRLYLALRISLNARCCV